jgi:hypothetical protein
LCSNPSSFFSVIEVVCSERFGKCCCIVCHILHLLYEHEYSISISDK